MKIYNIDIKVSNEELEVSEEVFVDVRKPKKVIISS